MKWFKNLNATPRLMLAFSVLIVIIMGMSVLAISKLAWFSHDIHDMYGENMVGSVATDNLEIAKNAIGRDVRDALANINDPQIVAAKEKLVLAELADLRSSLDTAEKAIGIKECLPLLAAIRSALPAYDKSIHEMLDRLRAGDSAGAKKSLAEAVEAGKDFAEDNDKVEAILKEDGESMIKIDDDFYQSTRTMMIVTTALAIGLGIFMALMIARGFSVPLGFAVDAMKHMAEGDLTVDLDSDTKDEVGRMSAALNEALKRLRATLEEVNQGALHASSSSQQLASASGAIASGAQEQAASLEETSASLEQITATVRQSADNARQASQLAVGSKDAAEKGQEVVSNAVTAMAEINAASAKIAEIISTIDEIAFQTNLLAVNAAVEAARAGEEGRGFAVVATEVRSLAQRSAGAAKEIKGLIQDSLRKVERGTELVNKSGETLQGIVASVKRVTDIVGEIAAAAAEQSAGIDQVNKAMTQMDQVTQSNSAQTEELSATAEALSEQASHLLQLVSAFTLGDSESNGRDRLSPERRSAPAIAQKPGSVQHAFALKGKKVKPAKTAAHGAGSTAGQPSFVLTSANGAPGSDSSFEEF